jgi:hypothetical protein
MKTINRYIAHYNNNRFSRQTAFIYVTVTSKNLAQMPVITFNSIYHYCCHDRGSFFQFKSRDRAVKHDLLVMLLSSRFVWRVL